VVKKQLRQLEINNPPILRRIFFRLRFCCEGRIAGYVTVATKPKTDKKASKVGGLFVSSCLIVSLSFFSSLHAEEYQSTEDFLHQIFSGTPPKPKVLWLKKDIREKISHILQHKLGFLRTRYWQTAEQSVWIINEVGKTKPITVAVIIKDNKIDLLKVLAFRESRGWEVKHDFFTDQFKQNTLTDKLSLAKPIDGISGATLSVRALTKIAQMALFFNSIILNEKK
jgi:hypothetical protein